jgi:zinc protease
MTVQDVRAFFETYYVPNNATLAIAGDFNSADTRTLVGRYFGGLPRGTAIPRPVVTNAPLSAESRIALEDQRGNTRQLWIGWRGAPTTSPDRMALTALAAILGDGATSRLYRTLVGDRKLATTVPRGPNGHFDLENGGILQLVIVPAPTASMTEIEGVVDSIVAGVRNAPVKPEELRRWLATYSVALIRSSQSDSSKARILGEGESLYRTPAILSKDIEDARRLTPADLQRVARKYLTPGRVVMSIVPAGRLDLVSKPNEPFTNVTRRETP